MQTIRIEGQEVTVVGETTIETEGLVEEIKKEVGKVVLAHLDVGNFRSASTTTLTAAILTLLREQGIELVEDREEKQRQLAVKVDEFKLQPFAYKDVSWVHPEVKVKPWNAPYKMKGKFK